MFYVIVLDNSSHITRTACLVMALSGHKPWLVMTVQMRKDELTLQQKNMLQHQFGCCMVHIWTYTNMTVKTSSLAVADPRRVERGSYSLHIETF